MRYKLYPVLSVLLFGILYLYTAIGVLFVLILSVFRLRKAIHCMMHYWAKSVFIILGKHYTITGRENIDPDKKYILVANHGSLFDIVAIMSFYPGLAWFGHERLLKIPVFGRLLKMTNYIPFSEPTYRNTRRMIEQLISKSNEHSIAIFPEGTRTKDGRINNFYRGFIYLLRTGNLDILPVTLNGFYNLKPKTRFYIDFHSRLEIVIHKPYKREDLVNLCDNEIIETLKNKIESAYSESSRN